MEALPQYMAMGMTQAEFWEGPLWLAASYREAAAIRDSRADQEAWRLGAYVYQAVLRASPALNALQPSQPLDWLEEPFSESQRREAENAAARAERAMGAGRSFVETFAVRFNAKMQATGEEPGEEQE